ncbi:probable LRR receptor-like serine/threonine-protein kinase At3g47570 [Rhododendron vialii]|uniref:probable LRR receptor-like serine/threonine-protein kinase At3g47570 n=1 Tax=Rhododendron vialii TaxID=182163 RepID=UPI00265EBA08|nr:probable LRR receptor-like serine/threonine-protein kinase At3g47570 [Rhododendron vialii]
MAKWFLLVLYTALIVWWCNAPSTFAMRTNETDRLALLAFKAAIDDQASFGALSSWNDSVHYCDWHGIMCSRRHPDRVVKLDLTYEGLVGSLSPHIGNLSFLRRIILSDNNFHGPIPEEIGRLFRLQHIDLRNNSFGGGLPKNLSRCTHLEYLLLFNNHLSGNIPSELGSLSKLRDLTLSTNKISGTIPPSIGNLSLLGVLFFSECNLQGEIPEGIAKLRLLTFLSVEINKLSGNIPSSIYNISTLTVFSVQFNRLEGKIPPDIGSKFPNLRFLGFYNNLFTGMIPTSLSNASGLEYIYFGSNNFIGQMPKDLGELLRLKVMNFQANQLEDDISFISSLTNCTKLTFLLVNENLLKGSLPNSVANLSIDLSFLVLGLNQLHGSIPSGIGNLLNLTILALSSNYFSGHVPDTIGRFHKLNYLDLEMNKFTKLPSSLGNLSALNRLYLGQNNIRGSIPLSLGNCQQLLALDLSHNNLYGLIPLEIMNLSSISIFFNLSYNSLTGSLPSEVGSLKNLAKFDVSNNRLSGSIPNSLSGCLSLEVLHLEGNSFEGEIPQSLSKLRGLRELDLSRNNLTGLIPSYIGELALEILNLSFNMLYGEVSTQGIFRNASAISIVGMDNLCGGIADLNLPPCPSSMSKRKKLSYKTKIILHVVVALVISSTLAVSLFMFRHRQCVSRKEDSSKPSFEHQILRVSYADLLKATNGFSEANLVGVGNYASVYKGILDQDQIVVAVKVLNLQLRGALKSFMLECKALQTIRHRNLLKVLSACSSIDFHGNEFKAIIYEFMANGTLDGWLHQNGVAEHEYLKASQRLDISIDVASALEYLHCGCESTIIHGDLKLSNVLLDDTMAAHVGDFGLARIISQASTNAPQHQSNSSAIRGTIGYIAPEYGVGDMASTIGDVYSFGILLLEMFTGKRPTDKLFKDHLNLHNFIKNALPDQVMDLVDPSIQLEHNNGSWINDCMVSILTIGVACSSELPRDRMEMGTVVSKLCNIKKYLGERRLET